jgi:hypothetical protein
MFILGPNQPPDMYQAKGVHNVLLTNHVFIYFLSALVHDGIIVIEHSSVHINGSCVSVQNETHRGLTTFCLKSVYECFCRYLIISWEKNHLQWAQ